MENKIYVVLFCASEMAAGILPAETRVKLTILAIIDERVHMCNARYTGGFVHDFTSRTIGIHKKYLNIIYYDLLNWRK
jgi:hypothetical protein